VRPAVHHEVQLFHASNDVLPSIRNHNAIAAWLGNVWLTGKVLFCS
jgi:hypothetical protein